MKLKIYTLQIIENLLTRIIPRLQSWRERVAICPDCGQNRYTGEPCIKQK